MLRMLDQEVLKLLGPDRRSNPGPELEVVERLGDVIDRAQVKPANLVVGRP